MSKRVHIRLTVAESETSLGSRIGWTPLKTFLDFTAVGDNVSWESLLFIVIH